MERFLGSYSNCVYAIMRILIGLAFAQHGAQQLFGVFAIGFLTGYAALISSGHMAFAYFIGHFPKGSWPIQNHGELAVFLCFIFLYIATQGGRMWSIDTARDCLVKHGILAAH